MNGISNARSVSATTSLPNSALPDGNGKGRSIGAPDRSARGCDGHIGHSLTPRRAVPQSHECYAAPVNVAVTNLSILP